MSTAHLLNKKEDEGILTWLSKTHYGAQQSDYLRRWHSKTCGWFLSSKEYQDWLNTKGTKLYCPGIPGAGKTIMAAAIINNISHRISSDTSIGLAYVYFTFSQEREQTTEHVLASLLMQLLSRHISLPQQIRELYRKHKMNGTKPTRKELSKNLKSVVSEYTRAYIILDALDECGTSLPQVLEEISELHTETDANVLVTSRIHDRIAVQFCQESTLTRTIDPLEADMELVLSDRMEAHDPELFSQAFRERIACRLSVMAKGMFLLAQLHLNALITMPTRGRIKRALGDIASESDIASEPAVLHDVYELTMERIASQGREVDELAKEILLWIVHARRPLSTTEIQYTLSVTPNSEDIDEDDIPSIKTLQSVCAGLVTIDTASNTIRLIHYTTQQYLERTQEKWFPDAQRQIIQTCMKCLSYPTFSELANSFYDYAVCQWGDHAQASPAMPEVLAFLRKPEQIRKSMLRRRTLCTWESDYCMNTMNHTDFMMALHVAIHFGLVDAVEELLGSHHYVEGDDCDPTALSHAVEHGRLAVIKLLLEITNVGVNRKARNHMTPLAWAIDERHMDLARQLLRTGKAEVNCRVGYSGLTALVMSAARGDVTAVQLLLETDGVDVNKESEYGQTPLSSAVGHGHTDVVRLLLQADGVNVNSKLRAGQTLLRLAITGGYTNVVKLLLETDKVDVNSIDESGSSPLGLAAAMGSPDIVKLLIETGGVDVNSKDQGGQTPLRLAIMRGQIKVVKLLLETNEVDLNSKDQQGYTPLMLASIWHRTEVFEMLATSDGVDVNCTDKTGQPLVAQAAKAGIEWMIQGLLKADRIDLNRKNQLGQTPLALAAASGHVNVVKLLANSSKCNVNSRDGFGRTPLAIAASEGYDKVVEVLIKTGKVVIDSKDNGGVTPLAQAAQRGSLKAVELLINTGKADRDGKSWEGIAPLARAAGGGHLEVVHMLLNSGEVDVHGRDVNGRTALSYAVEGNREAVVNYLVLYMGDCAWDDEHKFVVFESEMDFGAFVTGGFYRRGSKR